MHHFSDDNSLACFGKTIQEIIASLESEFEVAWNRPDRKWKVPATITDKKKTGTSKKDLEIWLQVN